ncbi:DUF6957 family protein [Pseudomonas iridis]|uniref:DUF6957 family protein n=1 Tax=Pseudomonas iridis TaxID=2710587 RepID=UPI0021C01F27|nr:hypothetical protein [Pseudomonas iridis]MCT8947069.1 hypothetical protein [Pseudomonas iridis]
MTRHEPERNNLMGCQLEVPEAKALVMEKFPGKPFCLVDGWELVDLEVTEAENAELQKKGMKPTVITALWVVHDSKGRYQSGTKMRSSFEKSFNDGYMFETSNTIYVLMGPGIRSRKIIDRDGHA